MGAAPRPERVFALRDLLGISLETLAKSAGLKSQGYLSDIANGRRPFTDQHVALLANAVHFPEEFFYVKAPEIENDSLNFRKLRQSKAKTTKKASQYFRETSRIVQQAAEVTGLITKPLPYVDLDADELDSVEIEKAAEKTRALMGLPDHQPVPNLTRAIERLGMVVAPVSLDPTDDEIKVVAEGHFGISHGASQGIPVIGYFPGASPDRDRFTLAHEVGHIVLHSRRISAEPEREANRYAGALLIPENAARSMLHPMVTLNQLARIKAQFGISIQALIMRGVGLGIIDYKRQRSLFVQLSSRGWRQNEPVEVEPEQPLLLRKLIELSLPSTPSTRDIERSLALPRTYVRAMAPSRSRRNTSVAPAIPLPLSTA